MPQIELIRPLELSPTGGSELTIANRGSNAVFYGQSPTVSSTNKTGTLNVGETLTITRGFVWVVAEATPVILDLREREIAGGTGGYTAGTGIEIETGVIRVSPSVVYSSGAVMLHPEEYGAKPTGDSSAAFNAMTADIIAKKLTNVAVMLGPKYELNGSLITSRGGNAIWAFVPNYGEGVASHMEIVCAPGGTNISSTTTGASYATSGGPEGKGYGIPSIIGGPTGEQLGFTNAHFSPMSVTITGTLTVLGHENATIGGLNFERVTPVHVEGWIYSAAPGEGAQTWTVGIRLPESDNNGVVLNHIQAGGYYCAILMNDLVSARRVIAVESVIGLGITGNQQYAGNDAHSAALQYLGTFHAQYHISGWSPTEGAISIPANTGEYVYTVSGVIQLWDIEEGVSGAGAHWETKAHILDANNQMRYTSTYGVAYGVVIPFYGRIRRSLIVVGAENFSRRDLNGPYAIASTNVPNTWTRPQLVNVAVRTNLATTPRPGLATSLGGWEAFDTTLSQAQNAAKTDPFGGTSNLAKAVLTAEKTNGMEFAQKEAIWEPVTAGKSYALSSYFYQATANFAGRRPALVIVWRNAGGAEISTTSGGPIAPITRGEWVRGFITGVAPAEATHAQVRLFGAAPEASEPVKVGDAFFFDGILFEAAELEEAYFDGATTKCRWTGEAYNSTSETGNEPWFEVDGLLVTEPDNAKLPVAGGLVGSWANFESFHANVAANSGAAARLEGGGATVKLRGALEITGTLASETTLATLPASYRPQARRLMGVDVYPGKRVEVEITTGGKIVLTSGAANKVESGQYVLLDSIPPFSTT